ncbi:hypothetical protein [Marinobacterium weihaiense]|uniref:Uncharacterized protein n=1 Tax=Marinobacterium weihaiense TaxID=2851016 RepID=A0ABS6MDY5_9GAMM|nr:hypothetical protein [Marinobacterium weihaiense]MBV0934488.1 hypothetical protein [Marinobacterium weihaiense]
MRWIGRALLLMLAMLLCWLAWQGVVARGQGAVDRVPALVDRLQLQSRAVSVYEMSPGQWLTFAIPSRTRHMRLLSNAAAAGNARAGTALNYVVEYELLDSAGQVLHRSEQFHGSRIPEPRWLDGTAVPPLMFADTPLAVASGQFVRVALTGWPEATHMRVRWRQPRAGIKRLVLRTYREERFSPQQAVDRWERLNARQRTAVTDALIAPAELVSEHERLNLLTRQWQPVGPQDVAVQRQRLFIIEDERLQLPSAPPVGRYLGPERDLVIPVAEAARYRLLWQPEQPDGVLEWRQHDDRYRIPSWQLLDVEAGAWLALTPGLVELRASVPGHVDLVTQQRPDRSALPPRNHLSSHPLTPVQPLRFALAPGTAEARPLRLDLRLHMPQVPLPPQVDVSAHYRILGPAGRELKQGMLSGEVLPSRLDRAADPSVPDLSDPLRFYLQLPPGATAIEVTSRHPLLANAYTRPLGLAYRRQLPANDYARREDEPGWFLLKPEQAPSTPVVLQLQSRLPERKPAIVQGRYLWRAVALPGVRSARLLTPLRSDDKIRDEALPAYFRPLPTARDRVQLAVPASHYAVRPELVYLRTAKAPFSLRLTLDDHVLESSLSGRMGSVRLPHIEPGEYRLRVQAPEDVQWLLNYQPAEMADAPGFTVRRAYWLDDSEGVRVNLDKRADLDQSLGARFYPLAGEAAPVIRLQVQSALAHDRTQPQQAWTYRTREYYLPATQPPEGYVFGQPEQRLAAPQSLFFALEEDIADGPVGLHFTLLQGQGYLEVFELLPGDYPWADAFEELQP